MNSRRKQTATPSAGRQRGMSLIELMVALGLSGALLAGVVGVFVTMFQADRTQESISRIQESGRFGLNFLSQELRMAGYLGCSSTLNRANINSTLNSPPTSFQPTRNIQGWEADNSDPGVINNSVNNEAVVATTGGGWSTSGGSVLDATSALPGTDIFRLWGADPTVEATILAIVAGPSTSATVRVTNNISVTNGEIMLLSDCERADFVQVCSTSAFAGPPVALNLILGPAGGGCSPGNGPNPNLDTEAGAQVLKLAGTVFYVGKRGNVATNPPALFRRRLGLNGAAGTPEELVEGIEDMQILYGENTNNDNNNAADRFVPADQVTTWNNVVAIRITLLVQSIENNLVPAPQPYTFNGMIYNGTAGKGALPPDRRLRRVFTSTINLRNVTLGG